MKPHIVRRHGLWMAYTIMGFYCKSESPSEACREWYEIRRCLDRK